VNSCLYEGTIRHRRHVPVHAELRYPLFMVFLDLDELPGVFDGRWMWSARRPAAAWFRRADHLGDPARGLAPQVRELVQRRTGERPEGPIRLLTHLRYFGHCFNPVSFYYCHGAGGELEAVVADVTNTPWGDRHAYVLPTRARADHGSALVASGSMPKQMHVSPLLHMRSAYRWRVTAPGESLAVHIDYGEQEEPLFDATLSLRRREMTPAALRRALVRYPLLTLRITGRIYAHALALRLRGAPYFPRPRPERPAAEPRHPSPSPERPRPEGAPV